MNKILKTALLACIVTGASMLVAKRVEDKEITPATTDPINRQQADADNKHAIDSAISILRSGYLVLRTGLGADSYLLSQMNQKNKTYSHCGIVFIEHGYPFVYHSIGGEDNPDERLRRDSAKFYFSPAHNSGFAVAQYDYDSSCINRLRQVVYRYYRERRKFDMKFDLSTDDKLYCAEFVYKAVNTATGDSTYIRPTSMLGYRFVGIDDLFVNEHAHIIWQVRFK